MCAERTEIHRTKDWPQRQRSSVDWRRQAIEVPAGRFISMGERSNTAQTGRETSFDLVTGESFWVSNVKRDGTDRHSAGSGRIRVQADAVEEYLSITGSTELDRSRFVITHDIRDTDPSAFVDLENRSL